MATSKTARKNQHNKAAGAFQASAASDPIISLAGGTYCYVLDATNGKTHKFATDSDALAAKLAELADAGYAERYITGLDKLAADGIAGPWAELAAPLKAAATVDA